MTVDVVVVAYNSRDHLRACVEPLAGAADIEVFVADNACPQRSPEVIADLPVRVVDVGHNAGFAAGCNAGAREGSSDAVLFLNPDARIESGGLRRLTAVLEEDETCAVVGPHVVGDHGETQFSMRRAPSLRRAFSEALFLHHPFPRGRWTTDIVRDGYDRIQSPAWVSGSVLLVRRRVFEELGGFNERFFMYSEDTDLCIRARERGLTVRYEPGVTARHTGGASAPAPRQAQLKALARVRYARAHERGLRYAAFRLAFAVHELVRIPVAAVRSRDHFVGRLAAFRAATW